MRKISADYVFNGYEFIKNGIISFDNEGRVLSVNPHDYDNTDTEFYEGLITPGFINSHCHFELSYMEGKLKQGGGMAEFCKGIMRRRGENENLQQSLEKAYNTMLAEGIVAVGDISNSQDSFDVKKNGKIHWHTFVECFGFGATVYDAVKLCKFAAENNLSASVTPHAPYSMSDELFEASVNEGIKSGILSIHNQESADERDAFEKKTGNFLGLSVFGEGLKKIVAKYDNAQSRILDYIDKNTSLLLVHNTYTTGEDCEKASSVNNNITRVLCPLSNLYIENCLPNVTMLAAKGEKIAIGTDSLTSNTCLSIIEELKTLTKYFPALKLSQLLLWATINGAEALKIDDRFGSFEAGKTPGAVLISNVDYNNMQLTNESKSVTIL